MEVAQGLLSQTPAQASCMSSRNRAWLAAELVEAYNVVPDLSRVFPGLSSVCRPTNSAGQGVPVLPTCTAGSGPWTAATDKGLEDPN
jgi:hypothetical protein